MIIVFQPRDEWPSLNWTADSTVFLIHLNDPIYWSNKIRFKVMYFLKLVDWTVEGGKNSFVSTYVHLCSFSIGKHTFLYAIFHPVLINCATLKPFMCSIFPQKHKYLFTIPIIHDTGCWNYLPCKTRTYLFYIVNIMGPDVLDPWVTRASATMTWA